jgi:hypothetical protein
MAAESLQLGADEAFLGQKRDDLVPEEMWIHPLLNPCGQGVGVNNLTDVDNAFAYSSGCVRRTNSETGPQSRPPFHRISLESSIIGSLAGIKLTLTNQSRC